MELVARFSAVSGLSDSDCVFVCHRFDEEAGFTPSECDSWVFWGDEDSLHLRFGGPRWITGIWYSDTRTAYIPDSKGKLTILRDVPNATSDAHAKSATLDAALMGVWGLSDELVVAWGDNGDEGRMFVWNGKKWGDLPSPAKGVYDVKGLGPKDLVAVGEGGLIATWNGSRWTRVEPLVETPIAAVAVVSPDEMYAVAGRRLLEGSRHGWAVALEAQHDLFGVAKFKDELWVGGGEEGLFKRKGKKLQCVKDNIPAELIEARQVLLAAADHVVATSVDGKAFRGFRASAALEALEDQDPGWR
jgi:hypothetical protein